MLAVDRLMPTTGPNTCGQRALRVVTAGSMVLMASRVRIVTAACAKRQDAAYLTVV
jgi:hypothetical protein